MRHAPSNNAHTASLFIAQGHHDSFVRKLNVAYRARRELLTNAFVKFLPQFHITPSQGGSGAWVKGPDGLNCVTLAQLCAARGVLIEPGEIFFRTSSTANLNYFRLGYGAIQGSAISAGVEEMRNAYLSSQS
jgi:GntR family transcriptional regulator/MocR family aminotransferase